MKKKCLYTVLCVLGGVFLPFILEAQPTAGFSSNKTAGCPPIVVQFSDQSTGNPTSWHWDLGNGTVSNLQNPSTTYLTAGTYTVKLTVTNANGTNTKTTTNYINVAPAPAVNFVADSSLDCVPKTIQFTNLSTPGGSGTPAYLWDFGDGNTSQLEHPSHTYTTPGNYAVSLVISNSNGCVSSLAKKSYLKLSMKPAASFTATNTSSCNLPLTTSFTNTATGGNSYYWDFGDGSSSTQQSPTHTYTTAGNYTVKLVVTSASGCKDSTVQTALVKAGMLQAAYTSADTVCAGGSMSFTNTTAPEAQTYLWLFGDGGSSTAKNPVHTYSQAGSYTARLVAQYGGCTDTVAKSIQVTPLPQVQFSTNDTIGCAVPFNVSFTNTSSGAASYLWLFGDGSSATQANPTHTYNTPGVYTVKLIATGPGGCKDTLVKTNYIKIQIPTATLSASVSSGCLPASPVFTANINSAVPITSYSWNFGDNSTSNCSSCPTISHTYQTAGVYNVVLTYTTANGCTKTVKTTVRYGNKPTASFTQSDTTICPVQSVSFTNTSTGATSYAWSFGDGGASSATNPSRIYAGSGYYTVRLIATNNGCSDTLIKPSLVQVALPKSKFSHAFSCNDRLSFNFTDLSTGADTYLWDFGDGTTSTTSGGVTHKYSSFGNYNVKLTVKNNASGCTHTYTQTVKVYDLVPAFSANDTSVCKGQSIQFAAELSGNYANYLFRYGNGAHSASATYYRNYTYTATGNYNTTLVVTDKNGCKDSITKTNHITVNGPVATFDGGPLTGCVPLTVNFQEQSTAYGSAITARKWHFGNGETFTSLSSTATQQYTVGGNFNVKLVVTDANGCTDSLIRNNYVKATKPTAAFSSPDADVCGNQDVVFSNTSIGSSLSSHWDFGDGTTSTLNSPTHAYTNAGKYTVKLIVTDGAGCKDSITKTRFVNVAVPKAVFTMSDSFASCPPLTVNFDNTSVGAATYSWTFGNGSQSVLDTPATVYTYPGNYTVKLKSIAPNGCADSATKTVLILGPTGTFSYNAIGCSPLTVQFNAVSNNTVAYIWDMNDGYTRSTSAPNTVYTYTQHGKFVPKLILSDGATCMVPIQGLDTVMADKVDGDFTFANTGICQYGPVQFFDTVYSSIFPVTYRHWDFGDGHTASKHNPEHHYQLAGTYQVRLIMGNTKGCQDTIIKSITVQPKPVVSAGADQYFCGVQDTTIKLHATGASNYRWIPSTGLSCTDCASPELTATASRLYTVIGSDNFGCADTASVNITIHPLPAINAGNDITICEGEAANLQASGGSTYEWLTATGVSCITCPGTRVQPITDTRYIIRGTDGNGCTNTDTVLVTVKPRPVLNVGSTQKICVGDSVQLQVSGATSYSWLPATGLSCTGCSNPAASPNTTTTYTVVGSNGNGCFDTAQITVVVNPLPVVYAADQSICFGDSTQLQASGADSYQWTPASGLSCSTCPDPVVRIIQTTTYTVTGTDSNGCAATAQATVTVKPLPVVDAGTGQTICEGSSVTLTASGANSYSWTPASGLSCTGCSNPVATPATTTWYKVTGTINGCSSTDSVLIKVLPKPQLSAGYNMAICSGTSTILQASGALQYTWSPSESLSCNTCPNPVASPASTTVYTLTGTDSNGCTATATVTVTVNPLPNVSAGPDIKLCENTTVQLVATGASGYLWSPPGDLSCNNCPNPIAAPTVNAKYKVVGIDINGCRDSDEVEITIIEKQPTDAGAGDTLCRGEATQLWASGGTAYLWFPAHGLNSDRIATPDAIPEVTTEYQVLVYQGDCFVDTHKVTVVVNDTPSVNAGEDLNAMAGDPVTINTTGSGATKYVWTPADGLSCDDCPSPISMVRKTTTYKVTVYNDFGCKNEDEVNVFVTCDQSRIFVANTFTPNGDGNNDRFYPQGKGISQVQRFRVYNRWGQLLFDRQSMPLNEETLGWDGTYKGEPLKPDVFVYILNTVCESGEPIEMKGDISLLR